MLKRFVVENFKCFKNKLVFDLSKPGNYSFETDCIQHGIVSKGAIFGINGIGKSNLGLALFDIVNTLTDKYKLLGKYEPFLNLNSKKPIASFEYVFQFGEHELVYSYSKKTVETLINESLSIDGDEMLFYDFRDRLGFSVFKGSEVMNITGDSPISRVKYIMNSAVLDDADPKNRVLSQFKHFVNSMLLFYSLRENNFIGFNTSASSCPATIIRAGKLKDFEAFLADGGLNLRLVEMPTKRELSIGVQFENEVVEYVDVASTGMISAMLYYSWLCSLSLCSFVYIDEFDAFYHHEFAVSIIKELKRHTNTQIFVSTHNTDLLSNNLLRPDSYFVLTQSGINSLNHLSEKELRFAHNLQKMFKEGAFN